MRTVGDLMGVLSLFDPDCSLGVVGVQGGPRGDVYRFALWDNVEVQASGEAGGGVCSVWLVASREVSESLIAAVDAPPAEVMSARGCGCVLQVPVVVGRPVSMSLVGCDHQPPRPSSLSVEAAGVDTLFVRLSTPSIGEVDEH
jgi:hypothetical protein